MVLKFLKLKLPKRDRFPIVFAVAMFISFQLYGVGTRQIFSLHFGPWDFVLVTLLIPWLAVLAVRGLNDLNRSFVGLLVLSFLFTTWVSISALFSPDPFRALTMLLQQVRNLVLLLMVGTLFVHFTNVKSLNQAVLLTGAIVSAIAIFFYSLAWINYSKIVATPALWKPHIIYVLDQGGVLRLTGFAKDPNFYSLWISPALFVGLTIVPFSFSSFLGFSAVGFSCLLGMSRGFMLAFIVSTVFLIMVAIFRVEVIRQYVKRIIIVFILAVVVTAVLQMFDIDLWGFFLKRVELIKQTPRFAMWRHLVSNTGKTWNPFWGTGLRGAQQILGGMYSHNSYFDVLFETGVPGFVLWLSILIYTSIVALKRIRNLSWLPWIHTWFILLVMFGAFSLAYNPFPWFIASILCAAPFKRELDYTKNPLTNDELGFGNPLREPC